MGWSKNLEILKYPKIIEDKFDDFVEQQQAVKIIKESIQIESIQSDEDVPF